MSISARAKRVEEEVKLDFKDVLIRPRLSLLKSRSEVDLRKRFKFLNSKAEYYGVPVIASNMDTVGTFEMAIALAKVEMFTVVQKHYSVEQWKAFAAANPDVLKSVAMSAGMTDDLNDLAGVLDAVPELAFICLDVANGYSTHFVDYVRRVRERFPRHTIMAGNVVTSEMVEILLQAGADIIKIGIGPGSVCTTRRKTGVGYPQLSAVLDCAEAAHRLGGHVISDGGCTCAGDVAKAFGAGADFVMLGGMLAGHAESGGDLVVKNGRQMKMFYGMSSQTAQHKYHGGLAEYRASEGKTVEIEYRGEVAKTLLDILGGLRSACTYVGAPTLGDFGNCCTFIRCLTQTNDIFSPFTTGE